MFNGLALPLCRYMLLALCSMALHCLYADTCYLHYVQWPCIASMLIHVTCIMFNGLALPQLLLDVNAHIRELRKLKEDVDVLEIVPVQQLFGKYSGLLRDNIISIHCGWFHSFPFNFVLHEFMDYIS